MFERTSTRLAAFAAGLALVGGAAAAAGGASDATPPFQDCMDLAAVKAGIAETEMAPADEGGGHGGEPMIEAVPGADGLRSELAGLTLDPATTTLTGSKATWRFAIRDCDGEAVQDFEPENGKLLHLIVVRTDFEGYQHLHPAKQADGTWTTAIDASRPGRYRAIADIVRDGRKYVVGTTITVPGRFDARQLPEPSLHASVAGYDVELQRPAELEAEAESQLTFRITRDGEPVRNLEPYLGAYGHLVALHSPDLAYSHVHPAGESLEEGAITFDTELHEEGPYRLFLQFQIGGRVHTAAFTQEVH